MAFQELADGTQSKQKAEYVSHTLLSKKTNNDYIEITYTRLDGTKPGEELKAGAFVTSLSEESRNTVKKKGQFVIVKTKAGKFWNLTEVNDVSTYVDKPTNNYTRSNTYTTSKSNNSYNTAGIKVGAVLHDAVALAGTGATTAKVKTIAEELLSLSYELESNVNAGKYEPKTNTTSKANTQTVAETTTTSLENIDF